MAFINDRNISTDTLICDKIISDPSKGASNVTVSGLVASASFGAPSPLTGSYVGVVYSKFTGTPFLLASASATNQVMDQFTLPPNVLTTGHLLRFTIWGVKAGDTNIGTVAVYTGSAAGAYQTTVSGGTVVGTKAVAVSSSVWEVEIDWFQSAASVQRTQSRGLDLSTILTATDVSLTQDMTVSRLITLALSTATSAASCTIYGWSVQII